MTNEPSAGDEDNVHALRTLAPLAPVYDKDAHKAYVEHLVSGLEDDQVRNIALTGGYGAGKSSVIAGLTNAIVQQSGGDHPAPVTLSLSSLEGRASSTSGDEGAARRPLSSDRDARQEQANQIAKALVTQLLYVRKPSEVPDSRYPRSQPYQRWRARWTSAGLGLAGTAWVSLAGWNPLSFPDDLLSWASLQPLGLGLLTASGLAGSTYGVQLLLRRYAIASVAAGGAALSLTKRSDDYLDEFLDEIVYFFQTTRTDIVIFEDLDRFENPAIFEELRELNTVLNRAAQVHQTVRFIYAIRDSVFEQLTARIDGPEGSAAYEMERANRTKFFDLVVPIVPFITHRNARDLMSQELASVTATLGEEAKVRPQVVGLVARHFTDMRAIKNLCNEYQIFAHALLIRQGGVPDLEPDALFAMIAYKCLCPGDFELVLRGQSKLDTVYTRSRELITGALLECERKLRRIIERDTREHRRGAIAAELNQRLLRLIEIMSHQSWRAAEVGDEDFASDEIATPAFWDALLRTESGQLTVQTGSGHRQTLQIAPILKLLDCATIWPRSDNDSAPQDRLDLEDKIAILRAADMKELLALPELIDAEMDHFDAAIADAEVSSMARELIEAGYIDRYFGLYVGRFHETTLSKVTVAYIHRYVDQASFDATYTFENPENIGRLLAEVNAASIGVSAYNVEIVNYLFTEQHPLLSKLAEALADGGEDADKFLTTYWSLGARTKDLAGLMARHDEDLLTKLTEKWNLTEEHQLTLADAALTDPNDFALRVDDKVRSLLTSSYQEMAAFKSPQPEQVRHRIVNLLDFPIPNLTVVEDALRSDLVAVDQYTLTRGNLQAARGTLRLSELPNGDGVFGRCVRELPTYLEIARANAAAATIQNATDINTLLDRLSSDDAGLGYDASTQLVDAITPADEFVDDLATYPATFWAALVENQRVTLSAYNLHTYLDDERAIDESVAAWIGDRNSVTQPPPAEPENPFYIDAVARGSLAVEILNAADNLPEPRQRVNLATSLVDVGSIDALAVTPADGELLALLLEKQAVDDQEGAVRHFLSERQWSNISAAAEHLQTPTVIVDVIVDGTIPADQVPNVLESNLAEDVLAAILEALPDLVSADDAAAQPVYEAAARTALALDGRPPTVPSKTVPWLTPQLISRFITAGVDDSTVVSLIPSMSTATDLDLRGLLRSMRPPYAGLAEAGASVLLDGDTENARFRKYLYKQRILKGPGKRGRTRKTRGKFEVHVR